MKPKSDFIDTSLRRLQARVLQRRSVVLAETIEDVDVTNIFQGELPTPKSLEERSVYVQSRDGARQSRCLLVTIGIP